MGAALKGAGELSAAEDAAGLTMMTIDVDSLIAGREKNGTWSTAAASSRGCAAGSGAVDATYTATPTAVAANNRKGRLLSLPLDRLIVHASSSRVSSLWLVKGST